MSLDRVVLVTGANGGIGSALCSGFRENGWRVIATDQHRDNYSRVDTYVEVDLARLSRNETYAVEKNDQITAEIGKNGLHCLINNAATQRVAPVEQLTADDWHATLDTNVVAPFLLVRALLENLEKAGGGVINIASIHAQLTKPFFTAYATSKAALVGLTRSMAVEIGNRVRVNAICPAAIATPMLEAGFKKNPNGIAQLADFHPCGSIGSTDDMVQAALFLAGTESVFLNGAVLGLDGGIASRLHDPD
ncbi:MAG: SDR family oxidoreductase [Candidatus Electrothrix sp. AR4]|nr:SDR family oxidoreductase [Candidatus Electrothrix sp. AR4]